MYEMGSHPARVTQIRIGIVPPPGLPADRRDAFLAVASNCPVHNSLDEPPSVQITVEPGDVARLRPRSALA
jgi:putative redox protein